jgi:predicted short-subunit dehydrogenase-like oxidoreductase (DUF2520 family)
MRRVSFIGAGNVGTTLAVLLRRTGYTVAAVSSRTTKSCDIFMRYVKQGKICDSIVEAAKIGEIVFITTNDDAIESVCEEISIHLDGKVVIHCSGALTTDVFAHAKGAGKAAIHPMQAIPCVGKGVKSLPGSYFDVQCDDKTFALAKKLVHDIGGIPVRISREQKVLNHIASCMISNFSVALFTIALELYKDTGMDEAQATDMLMPMFEENVRNIRSVGAIESLTGPIERGDINTIKKHLIALGKVRWIKALYICLARSTLKLAEKKGLEPGKVSDIKALLKSHVIR